MSETPEVANGHLQRYASDISTTGSNHPRQVWVLSLHVLCISGRGLALLAHLSLSSMDLSLPPSLPFVSFCASVCAFFCGTCRLFLVWDFRTLEVISLLGGLGKRSSLYSEEIGPKHLAILLRTTRWKIAGAF